MTMCANVDLFNTEIETFIEQYESMLEDGMLSEIDSSDTREALDRLYSYKQAIDAQDLEYINAQGKDAENTITKQGILEDTFKKTLGQFFMFSNGNSNNPSMGTLVSIEPSGTNVKVTYTEKSIEKSHIFSMASVSRSTADNKKFINIPGFANFAGEYNLALARSEEDSLVLGSSESRVKLGEDNKQTDYKHGNTDSMKTMLKRMHLLGGEKASDAELDTHIELLNKISPSFFNDMELYLEEAGDNSEGVTRSKRIDVVINPAERNIGNQQSEASVYMEEVVHSMTASAMHSKTIPAVRLKRKLAIVIEQARKHIKWQDFLPAEGGSIDSVKEEEYAKWLYNYLFTGKNADFEFVAKALTVPEVSKAFSRVKVREGSTDKSILSRINEFFATVIEILSGNITLKQYNQNVHESVVNLAFAFGEINNRADRNAAEKGGFIDKTFEVLNQLDDNINLFSRETKDKVFGDIANIPENTVAPTTLYGRVKDLAKFIGLSLVNPVHTKAMGVLASSYGLKPEGTVREIIGGMFATDSVQKVAEFLTMQSGHVDKQRNDQIDLIRKNILSKFKSPKDVTPELEEALTAVIADTELSYLFGNDSSAKDVGIRKTVYTNKTLRKLLTDDEFLNTLIDGAKKALKEIDKENYYWHANQSVGLGIFMATHKGTPEQNLNAHNIARGLHSSHERRSTKQLEKAIDELSTLVAIKNTGLEQRTLVATAMTSEWGGVQHVADVVEGFKKNTDTTVFRGRKTNKIKGYTREVFDDTIVMEIAPLEDRKKMEDNGFIYKTTLNARAGEIRVKKMALYVTDSATRVDRLRGGVRLNQITSKGTTITDTTYKDGVGFSTAAIRERAKNDISRIHRGALAQAKIMETGDFDFTNSTFGVVPVLDDHGNVVDYRYMMDKKTKMTMLKQDTKVSEVMARSFGSLVDKDLSVKHNKKVLDALKEDMNENWEEGTVGNDGMTEYSLLGPKAADPEMRKLYYMMPSEFQAFVNAREDKTLAVRRDLLFLYFGYSHMTIANFPGLQKITPKVVVKFIKMAEMIWMEMIKVVKTNILIKMPTVLLGNIFSNMVHSVLRGYNPLTVAKMYVESYRDIKTYNKNAKRLQELDNYKRDTSAAISRDSVSDVRKATLARELTRNSGERKALEKRIKDSPIHELVMLGLDQNVEDSANDSERSSNRLVKTLEDKVTSHFPDMVQSGLDIMFITRKTKFYKVANEFLEVSDLIARDVQNRLEEKIEVKQADGNKILPAWWLEGKEEGYKAKQPLRGVERAEFIAEAKQQRLYELVEDYVAYVKPSGRFEEWANRAGILMFTKYVKRIQRIIAKSGMKGPSKVLITAMVLGLLGGLPSILDQSFLLKDFYTTSIGAGNIFPVYNLGEHVMNAVTPSIIKSSTYNFAL